MTIPALVRPLKRGFTLIETLLYIVLSSLIITGVLVSTYPILTGASRLSERVMVEHEAIFVLRKINWALGQAVTAVIVSPAGDILTLTTVARPLEIKGEAGAILINNVPITASRTVISDFSAVYTPKSGSEPGFLEISFKATGVLIGPVRYNVYF